MVGEDGPDERREIGARSTQPDHENRPAIVDLGAEETFCHAEHVDVGHVLAPERFRNPGPPGQKLGRQAGA